MQSAFLKYSHICGGIGQISQCNSVWHYTTESKGVVVGGEWKSSFGKDFNNQNVICSAGARNRDETLSLRK